MLRQEASITDLARALPEDCPISALEMVANLGILRLRVPVGRELEVVSRLQASPLVEWAEPNYLRAVMRAPNDQLYRQFQWNMRKIQAEQAWDVTTGNPEVVVAVLDTGIDASHPDLAGKLLSGYDVLNDDSNPEDDSGHGTHNAGIIGAASDNGVGVAGVAWGARIMPLKVLNSNGVGPDSVIARGIVYAADRGAKIINMSFGSKTSSQSLVRAISYAHDKGVLLVAAAGNSANLDNAAIYPACFEQVLAVGAMDEADEASDFSQHRPYVAVSAPGVNITSTFWRGAGSGGYAGASGTSSAAPHVSGLAALIWSVNPTLTNDQVRQIIEGTVDDLGVPGRDEYYGAGGINAYRAVRAASSGTAAPSTLMPAPTPTPTCPPPPATPTPDPRATPSSQTTWYFAEGSTNPPFDLWLLLQNPNREAVTARVTFMKGDGSQLAQDEWLPPTSKKSVFVNNLVPNSEVSIKVESTAPLFAERSLYSGTDGLGSIGAAAPSTQWYMAEGSTGDGFDSWILLQNPQTVQANATLTFLTSNGERKELAMGIPPTSRRSVYLNQLLPDAEVSTVVLSDQPIVAERSMYFRQSGGHGGLASPELARSWYLAEGQAGQGFQTWLLILNPNPQAANLKVTIIKEDGTTSVGYHVARPGSRVSLYANTLTTPGRFGIQVDSDQPIAVERSVYFAGGRGGHNVVATARLSREWYLPEGSTKAPFTETIAIVNPGSRAASLWVTPSRRTGEAARPAASP